MLISKIHVITLMLMLLDISMLGVRAAQAHCDTMDGPVVADAKP